MPQDARKIKISHIVYGYFRKRPKIDSWGGVPQEPRPSLSDFGFGFFRTGFLGLKIWKEFFFKFFGNLKKSK